MSATPYAQPQNSTAFRSMGSKFFILLFLAAAMSLPALFVSSLAYDRAEARGALSTQSVPVASGHQHLLGLRLADSYRSTQRSLKYVTLFLGLVFLTYFVLEVHTGKRVHPGQYALVGVAQIIFYLLLLSLAEYIGFDFAFLIAGVATVLLFSANAEWVFRSRMLAMRACVAFSTLYVFIYVLLRLENYALLIGAIASFLAVGTTMYLTRSVDWYSANERSQPAVTGGAVSVASTRESWLD